MPDDAVNLTLGLGNRCRVGGGFRDQSGNRKEDEQQNPQTCGIAYRSFTIAKAPPGPLYEGGKDHPGHDRNDAGVG